MKGPTIDWAGLSPLLAVFGGALLVLGAGLLRARFVRETLVPLLLDRRARRVHRAVDLAVGRGHRPHLGRDARRHAGDVPRTCSSAWPASSTVLLSWRARGAAGDRARRVLRTAAVLGRRHGRARRGAEHGDALPRVRAPVDPAVRAVRAEMRRETSLESGLKYLVIGSVGSATLVYGLALLYGATGSTDFAAMAEAISARRAGVGLAAARRRGARARRPGASRRRSRRSTSGRPTSTRARPRRSPRSWRWRRRRRRSA